MNEQMETIVNEGNKMHNEQCYMCSKYLGEKDVGKDVGNQAVEEIPTTYAIELEALEEVEE